MKGRDYSQWVGQYIVENFSDRGIDVYEEIYMGKSIIGKNRRVDILVVDVKHNRAVALECKYQGTHGTVDEKVPYTLDDAKAIQMNSYVIYGGNGFSTGIIHMLEASELAGYSCPKNENITDFSRTRDTKELDHLLAMSFCWWDIFTRGESPISQK